MKTLVLVGAAMSACAGAFVISKSAADPPAKPIVSASERDQVATLKAERDKAMQMLAAMEKRVAELEKRLNATEAAHKQLSTTHNSLLERVTTGASGAAAAPAPAATSPGSTLMRQVDPNTWATPDGTTYTILPGGEVIRTDP
jgi:hypothetical protein